MTSDNLVGKVLRYNYFRVIESSNLSRSPNINSVNMEERTIKITKEQAIAWYKSENKVLKTIALIAFEENELRPSFAEIVSNVEYSYAVFPKDNKYIILGKIALLAEVYNEGKSVKSNETGYFFYKDKFGEIKITKHESVKYPGIIYFRNEKAVREVITILGDELNNLFWS